MHCIELYVASTVVKTAYLKLIPLTSYAALKLKNLRILNVRFAHYFSHLR